MCEESLKVVLGETMMTATRNLAKGHPFRTDVELTQEFMSVLPKFLAEFVTGSISCVTNTTTGEVAVTFHP